MKIISYNPSHDGAIAYVKNADLIVSMEAEKNSNYHRWKVAPHYIKPLVEGEATQVNNVATIVSRQNPKR